MSIRESRLKARFDAKSKPFVGGFFISRSKHYGSKSPIYKRVERRKRRRKSK